MQVKVLTTLLQQTFRSLSLTTSPSTATGIASMVKVQVRVDEQDTPQFSRLATLAGVSPPLPEADLQSAEQRQLKSQSRRERSHSKAELSSECQISLFPVYFLGIQITCPPIYYMSSEGRCEGLFWVSNKPSRPFLG